MPNKRLQIFLTLISLVLIQTQAKAGDFIFASGFETTNQVILGNLTDAQIKAYQLDNLDNAIETKTSSISQNLATAGSFELSLNGIPDDEWILVSATGGNDIDADDDGVLDATSTQNNGTIYALAKAQDWKAGGQHITALTDISWKYTQNLLGNIQPIELIIRQNELAKQFIQTDINNDTVIDYLDILAFIPNNQAQRANLNFNYQALFDVNTNNESYILATHAGATDLVESILDDLFAHTITRHVEPDYRYNTIVIDIKATGDGTITTGNNKTIISSQKRQMSNRMFVTKGTNTNLTFTASPNTNYHVYSWLGCDNVSLDLTTCFVNTNSNHDIIANFASDDITLKDYQGNTNVKIVDLSQIQNNLYETSNLFGGVNINFEIPTSLPSLFTQVQALAIGDLVVSENSAIAEGGFIRRVLSMTQDVNNPQNFTLITEDAILEDVIEDGTVNISEQLTNGMLIGYNNALPNKSATVSPKAVSAVEGVKLIPSQNADDTSFTLQIGDPTADKASSSYSLILYENNGQSITVNGQLTFNIDVDSHFNYKFSRGLEDFSFITTVTATEGLNIVASGALPEFAPDPKKLATLTFTRIKFVIGLIPVWITPKVDFFLGVHGEITTELSTGVTFIQEIAAGITYQKDRMVNGNPKPFQVYKRFDKSTNPSYPEATVDAAFEVYLKAKASMKIYDATGPAVSIDPYVKLESSASLGGDAWFIDHCVNGVDFGLSLGIRSIFNWDFSADTKVGEFLNLDQIQELTTFKLFGVTRPLASWHLGGTCTNEPPFMLVEGDPIIFDAPYTPPNKHYNKSAVTTAITLTNQGDVSFDWSGGYIQGAEVQVVPASGTLNAGQSTVVNVSLETNGLPVGRYSNPLLFENLYDTSLSTQESGTKTIPLVVDILPVDNVNTPTITSLTSPSAGLVNIQWSFDPSTATIPLNRYHIYSSTTPADPNSWNLEKIVGLGTNSQTLSGFAGGATVSFYVRAHGYQVHTQQSPIMSVTINGNVPLPATGRLNDTGITWGGDYSSGNNATCTSNITSPQDCHQGRDATHNDDTDGHAGFSFTKLDASGNPLAASATSWSCVRDNVTGLVWEVKTTDGGLHDKNDTYNWYNTDSATNGGADGYADDDGAICVGYNSADSSTFCNTQAYTARVNTQSLCGYTDWRIPDINELHSIVHQGGVNPAIDANYFPNTVSGWFWSSSPYADLSSGAWGLDFGDGYDDGINRSYDYYVRLVRGGQ